MKDLEKLVSMKLPEFAQFEYDYLQQNVHKNLYIEIELDNETWLFGPDNRLIQTHGPRSKNEAAITSFLVRHKESLESLKSYLLLNLAVYSDLLETNSYYLTANHYLAIARFRPLPLGDGDFEVKVYTINESDLKANYKDKIYLGRDFISLENFSRRHFGLDYIAHSVAEQFRILTTKMEANLSDSTESEAHHSFHQEIEGTIAEFNQISHRILESLPGHIPFQADKKEILREANRLIRDVKHILIELRDTLTDWERELYHTFESGFGRYVTKYKKDIQVDINYINAKINGRITDFINGQNLNQF